MFFPISEVCDSTVSLTKISTKINVWPKGHTSPWLIVKSLPQEFEFARISGYSFYFLLKPSRHKSEGGNCLSCSGWQYQKLINGKNFVSTLKTKATANCKEIINWS